MEELREESPKEEIRKEMKEETEEKEEHIDNFKCPRCNSKFGYTNQNDVRVCRNCGNRYNVEW